MTRKQSLVCVTLVMAIILALMPMVVSADENLPQVIEAQVLGTTGITGRGSPYGLMVQATSWQDDTSYRYVLTVANLTPWPVTSLRILDRYLPDDPNKAEVDQEWLPGDLPSVKAASYVFEVPIESIAGGCHQLEISLADGLSAVLMDCSPANSTTVWNVALTDKMLSFLAEAPLTAAAPSGRSKLGIHVTRNNSPSIMEFVRTAHPAAVVALADLGWLADVKKDSPETVTIGRLPDGDQTLAGDPVARARDFVQANQGTYLGNPSVDYWLGWNEPSIDGAGQMEWYAAFEAERVRAMAELGLKVAIGNFSTGTPEADEFAAFLPAVIEAKNHNGILALHEYSAPTLRDGVGAGIPGLESTDQHGSLTLRYRYWYDHYLKANDLVLPLIITEAGIDGGVLRAQSGDLLGWRDFLKAPDSGSSEATAQYLEQLGWYDDELRRDSYVLGFAIFNVGDRNGQWESFDVTGILPDLAGLVSSKQ